MNFELVDRQALLTEVVGIARAAGAAILSVYESDDFEVESKGDQSPLTKADRDAHGVIMKGLAGVDGGFPILSEESAPADVIDREQWATFWMVDPLDGTKEFIKRNGEFTVNIALVHAGVPVLGVVYAPVLDLLYTGIDGVGAWSQRGRAESEPIAVRGCDQEILRVVASRSHGSPDTESLIAGLAADAERVSMGSSLKLCLVADGSAHVYPRLAPTMEWDTAAAHAVVRAAGGAVFQRDGEELAYNKADLLNPFFAVAGPDLRASVLAAWQAVDVV